MKRKYSILDCHQAAEKHGGKCLSQKLELVMDRVIWECSEKHQWEQRFHNIRRGTWCPICSCKTTGENRKLTIQEMKKIAKCRKGKCLSQKYINAQTELMWECSYGHKWMAKPVNIKCGHWCLQCANMIPYTKQDLDLLATKYRGKCLSSTYQKAKTKYIWKCNKGHIFKKSWDEIKNKHSWCQKCKGRRRTISDLKQFAQKKGGECLSSSFDKMADKIQWKCSSGHYWKATASSIYRGSWCPKCKIYYTEEICRFILESLTQCEFKKIRLRFQNKLFELDGYSKILHLAFEHQGIQHYKFVPRFHKTKSDLIKIQKKDRKKKQVCSKLNIKLLVIPSNQSRLGDKHLIQLISKYLKKNNVSITGKVNFKNFHVHSPLEKLQKIAKNKKGKCLDSVYCGPHHKMQWECKEGHTWLASASSIKNNHTWCQLCVNKQIGLKRRKYSIDIMKQIAKRHEGECLSKIYNGTQNYLEWECSNNHVWRALPMSILKGYWCKKCRYIKNHT